MIEVWFFDTPYSELIRHGDWRGILLKAHINYLGQSITHCGIRINIGGLDRFYQSTWLNLMSDETVDIKYKPAYKVNLSYLNQVTVTDKLNYLFTYAKYEEIELKDLLKMLYGKPEKVKGMLCTAFILEALCLPIEPHLLYPDNLYKYLSGNQ